MDISFSAIRPDLIDESQLGFKEGSHRYASSWDFRFYQEEWRNFEPGNTEPLLKISQRSSDVSYPFGKRIIIYKPQRKLSPRPDPLSHQP